MLSENSCVYLCIHPSSVSLHMCAQGIIYMLEIDQLCVHVCVCMCMCVCLYN